MDTAIDYLELVREDLLDAGLRQGRRGPRRLPDLRGRFSGRALIAAASVVTLIAAGTIGWWVTRGEPGVPGSVQRRAVGRPEPASSPIPGELERFRSLFSFQAALVNEGDLATGVAVEQDGAGLSRVIRTGGLGLVLARDSFDDRFAEAVSIASSNGGFVADSTTRERSGTLVIRVPAENFDETLAALRDLGEVEVETIRGRDVSVDYVDLRARLRIAKARREVLLGLMEDAKSIEQTIRVQNALDDTQLRIEETQGQLNVLNDRVALATIQVHLREEGVEPEAEVDTPSIPNAIERSAAGFVGVIAAVVVGIGYLIPVALIGLAVWFVVSRIRRRRLA